MKKFLSFLAILSLSATFFTASAASDSTDLTIKTTTKLLGETQDYYYYTCKRDTVCLTLVGYINSWIANSKRWKDIEWVIILRDALDLINQDPDFYDDYFEVVELLKKEITRIYVKLAKVEEKEKNYEESLDWAEQIINYIDKESADWYYYRARAYYNLWYYEKAIDNFDKAIDYAYDFLNSDSVIDKIEEEKALVEKAMEEEKKYNDAKNSIDDENIITSDLPDLKQEDKQELKQDTNPEFTQKNDDFYAPKKEESKNELLKQEDDSKTTKLKENTRVAFLLIKDAISKNNTNEQQAIYKWLHTKLSSQINNFDEDRKVIINHLLFLISQEIK